MEYSCCRCGKIGAKLFRMVYRPVGMGEQLKRDIARAIDNPELYASSGQFCESCIYGFEEELGEQVSRINDYLYLVLWHYE